jgi:hypothetical protein
LGRGDRNTGDATDTTPGGDRVSDRRAADRRAADSYAGYG